MFESLFLRIIKKKKNLYSQTLIQYILRAGTQSAALNKNERYYYCKRESDSREVTGRGWWKATSHVKTISADGRLMGYKRPLTFHRFKDNQKKRKDAIKTDWIMHEYGLESIPTVCHLSPLSSFSY